MGADLLGRSRTDTGVSIRGLLRTAEHSVREDVQTTSYRETIAQVTVITSPNQNQYSPNHVKVQGKNGLGLWRAAAMPGEAGRAQSGPMTTSRMSLQAKRSNLDSHARG